MLGEEAREYVGDAALQQTGGTRDAQEPCGDARIWLMASFAACASSRSAKQWRWNVLPASVSERRRVVRFMRRTPSSVSNAAMRRLSFEVCKPNAFAAAVYEPKSTTLAKK